MTCGSVLESTSTSSPQLAEPCVALHWVDAGTLAGDQWRHHLHHARELCPKQGTKTSTPTSKTHMGGRSVTEFRHPTRPDCPMVVQAGRVVES